MTATQPLTPQEARTRRAHHLLPGAVIAAAAVAYLVVVAVVAGDLPVRTATHYGLDGVPDDSMATPVALTFFGLFAVGLPLLLLVVFASGQWWRGASAKVVSGIVSGLAVFLVALFGGLLWTQRGLTVAAEARLSPWVALGALGAGLLVGLAVALLLPPTLPQPEPVGASPMVIPPTDSVSWFGHARSTDAVLWSLLAGALVVVVAALLTGLWWLWLIVLLLALLVPATTSFRVRIDRTGLAWRSALGVPRGQLPVADVTGVSVVEVRAGDFGGYGIRSVPGATGVITRPGPALVVHRGDRRLVITVDDAATAASVLEGLRLRT